MGNEKDKEEQDKKTKLEIEYKKDISEINRIKHNNLINGILTSTSIIAIFVIAFFSDKTLISPLIVAGIFLIVVLIYLSLNKKKLNDLRDKLEQENELLKKRYKDLGVDVDKLDKEMEIESKKEFNVQKFDETIKDSLIIIALSLVSGTLYLIAIFLNFDKNNFGFNPPSLLFIVALIFNLIMVWIMVKILKKEIFVK